MAKKAYRIRNWRNYNQSLVNRGRINFWFNEDCIEHWTQTERTGKRGRPQKYNDIVIECGLTLKALFNLNFRSTEGFIGSLIEIMDLDLPVPDYSLLCKRQKSLSVNLRQSAPKGETINIVVDTTGLKIYGEGEWKVRQRGYTKRRVWRKLHVALNADSQEIEAFELTELGVQDCAGLSLLVKNIDKAIESVIGDGAYDRLPCYMEGKQKGFEMIAPPQRNASTTQERGDKLSKLKKSYLQGRDEAIKEVREKGRAEWKVAVGYHKRSLAETVMYRIKTLLGPKLSTRKLENQKIEAAVWCKIINEMTKLGMPVSYAID